jgi:CubicO group peptidase (beta-lactamase class C family)
MTIKLLTLKTVILSLVYFLAGILVACGQQKATFTVQLSNLELFKQEAESIRQALRVPGMTLGIMQGDSLIWQTALGQADIARSQAMQTTHLFPLASISKTMGAILLLQLEEQGLLSIEDPINKYLPEKGLPNSVKIYHLLSHTSEGVPQTFFEYSGRYGLLTDLIEKVSKQKYPALMNERILSHLNMQRTIPGVGAKGYEKLSAQIAKPYRLDKKGTILQGFLPSEGLQTSTGMVSCIEDLAKYARGIYQDKLLKPTSKQKMWTAMHSTEGDTLVYGLGWFITQVEGMEVIWHYGQEECYSTVLMYVPEKNVTLIMLANSATLSDHGRMLSGNPARSALFWAFFKHLIFSSPQSANKLPTWDAPLTEWKKALETLPEELKSQARETLISRLMVKSYLSDYQEKYKVETKENAEFLATHFPKEMEKLADPQILYVLLSLVKQGDYLLISLTEVILQNTLEKDKSPYVAYLAGRFYQIVKENETALSYFKQVADLPNFSFRWYQVLATYETGEILYNQKSASANIYLKRVINWGWNLEDVVTKARQRIK